MIAPTLPCSPHMEVTHKHGHTVWDVHTGYSGGFSLQTRTLGEGLSIQSSLICVFFVVVIIFFLSRNQLEHSKFYSLDQNKSNVAQRAKTTVAECSLTSCV